MREDWQLIRLDEYLDIQGGSQPPKSNFIYEPKKGYIQLLQIRDFGQKPVPTYVPINMVTKFCEENDVLIARYGASLGRIVTGLKGAYNVALAKVIDNQELFIKKYLFYLLQTSVLQKPLKLISRTAQNGFAKHEIGHIQLPLCSILEQKAIVAKIEQLFSGLDNGIANLKTAQAKLKIYRQAVLKKAFTKETPDGHFKKEQIINITTKVGSGSTPRGGKNAYLKSGVSLIRSMNIHFDKIKYDEMAYINDEQAKKLNNVEVKTNDVLLNITGASIGRANIAPENLDGARVNQHVSIIRLKQDLMIPKFLKYYIESPDLQNWITKENYGTTRQALTKTMILNLTVPLPSLEEQNQIVKEIESRLSVCDKIEETIETTLAKSEALRQSILKKAFEGKLLSAHVLEIIKNHPEYESAQALLERIQKERSKQ